MGDKITIKVIAANLDKRQLDFEWVIGSAEPKTKDKIKEKKKGKKKGD